VKPRAALLAGWYLLVPGSVNDVDGQLSKWMQFGAYDTAARCEREREAEFERARKDYERAAASKTMSDLARRGFWNEVDIRARAVCIATDDPRLK
jgi:hypothetical protein